MPDKKLDLLGRDKIINQIMRLIQTVSEFKNSTMVSLTGPWGSGKTFVLERLEEELVRVKRPGNDMQRYMVLHYNCWQYDYYDEPLISIISVLLGEIKNNTYCFSTEQREKGLKLAAGSISLLSNLLLHFALPSLTPELKKTIVDTIKSMGSDYVSAVKNAQEYIDRKSEFDPFDPFNKACADTKKLIETLSKDYTLVMIVDELDRCQPAYAIKILERLHHLFNLIPNCIILLAVDKKQLTNAVKCTFGADIDPDAYLRKSIHYEFSLPTTRIVGDIRRKYPEYFSRFEAAPMSDRFDVEQFLSALFDGIDMRVQERMMERLSTVHHLIAGSETRDYLFLCVELLLVVFLQYEIMHPKEITRFGLNSMPIVGNETNCQLIYKDMPSFGRYLTENWGFVEKVVYHGQMLARLDSKHVFEKSILCYLQDICSDTNCIIRWEGKADDRQKLDELKRIRQLLWYFR